MNMQLAAVAALFAVLTVIPQTVLSQNQFSSVPSSYNAVPQYEPYNQAYNGLQYPSQFSNGISGQEPASFQTYGDDQGIANVQSQYGYPYSYDSQYAGVPYSANGDAYQSAVPYPYQQQQQQQA